MAIKIFQAKKCKLNEKMEKLILSKKYKDRYKYAKYYIHHNSNSFFIHYKRDIGNYTEFESITTITLNRKNINHKILNKIEKETIQLFNKVYNISNTKKVYVLIAILFLLLLRYKIVSYHSLAISRSIKMEYIFRENSDMFRSSYSRFNQPRQILTMMKKIKKYLQDNGINVEPFMS